MIKQIIISSILITGLILQSGCYFDSEEHLYPQQSCDTLDVKYSDQVSKIFEQKCYDCHSNSTQIISGVSFEGYTNLSGYLSLGIGDIYLLQAINHEVGATPMPKDRPKLSECEIRTIEIWISNGYPNN